MRLIVFLLSTTLVLASAGPMTVVLDAVKQAREEGGSLEEMKGLAMSRFVGPNQRKALEDQWEIFAKWARDEGVTFVAGSEKIDGDLAAVVIGGLGEMGPEDLRVFGFGVLQDGEGWQVAVKEGSFLSSGLGFDVERVQRARRLESWIAMERVQQDRIFRAKALEDYRKALLGLVDPEVLRKASPEEAMDHFMNAVAEKDEKKLLVWQGVLERSVVDDYEWDRVAQVAKVGLEGKDRQKVWRLLTDPNVIRLKVSSENDDAETSVLLGFISPYETSLRRQRNRVLRFHLENHGAGWRVKMPNFLAYADEDDATHYHAFSQGDTWRDDQIAAELPQLFEKRNAARRGDTPDDLLKLVAQEVEANDYPALVRLLYRDPKPQEGEGDASPLDSRYQRTSRWWGKAFDKEGVISVAPLKAKSSGELAVGSLKVRNPAKWKSEVVRVWMRKTPAGWSFLPDGEGVRGSMPDDVQALEQFYREIEGDLENDAAGEVLGSLGTLISGKNAPPEKGGRELVEQWRAALVAGAPDPLLKKSGVIKRPEKPAKIVRDLSSAMKGARAGVEKDRIIAIKSEGPFQGVSMMIDAGRGLEMHCPLVIVAETDEGPRVLVDVELWLTTNRGKKMRNASALLQLRKVLNEKEFSALNALFDWHEKVAGPVWEEWEEARKLENKK